MKKFLTFVLVLAMVMSVSSVALAATSLNSTGFLALASSGVIILTDDVKISETVKISGLALEINLNGHSISGPTTGDSFSLINGAEVTVTGSGSITNESTDKEDVFDVRQGSSLTIGSSVTVTAKDGCCVFIKDTSSLSTSGTLVSNSTEYAAIQGNGTDTTAPGTTITISGGSVTANSSLAIYHPQAGTLNISGGTVKGETAIGIKAGELNISGNAEIVATGTYNDSPAGYSNGINANGTAIQIESNTDYAGGVKVNITGGTVKSENGVAIFEFVGKGIETKVESIAISGGEIISATGMDPIIISDKLGNAEANDETKVEIIGGKYSKAPNPELLDEGTAAADVDNGTEDAPYTIEPAKTSNGITIAPASLDFSTVQAGYSQPEAKMISVQGVDTSDKYVTVTVSAGYEVSSAKDSGYDDSVKLDVNSNAPSDFKVYVRPQANLGAGTYNGRATVQVNNSSDHPMLNDDNEVALTFVVKPNSSQTVEKPSSGGGYYGPNVWYIGGNTFGTNTNQVPTSVEIDGVPVSFTMNGGQITVDCITPGAKWVKVSWGSTTNTRYFTPDANAYCAQAVILKTGGMSFWAAIAQFLGF